MKLYLDNGYINMKLIMESNCPYIIAIGGRGSGKTYGALEWIIENEKYFLLMRRTMIQAEQVTDPEYSPFMPLNRDHEWNIYAHKRTKQSWAYHHTDFEDDGKAKIVSPPIGLLVALSTFSNIRGINGEKIDYTIYDEFIPEPHIRGIKGEDSAIFNVQESIGRNRELEGKSPSKMILLSNSDTIDHPILHSLGLVDRLHMMEKRGQEYSQMEDILLLRFLESPVSKRKKDTSLYRITKGTSFYNMAVDNKFIEMEDMHDVRTMPIREYTSLITTPDFTIYRHKKSFLYYVSSHKSGNPEIYGNGEAEKKRFKRNNYWIIKIIDSKRIIYEKLSLKLLLQKWF